MHLRKLTASLLSASLALGILATAVPAAQAQPWHGGHRGGGAGLAVGSGLAGLAVGAMLGSTLAERGAAAPPPAYYPTPAPAPPPPAYYPYGGGY